MKWQKRVISARNSASDTDGILSQQAAPSEPVEKVNDHSRKQPEPKSDPSNPRQAEHQIHTRNDTKNRNHRHPRRFKRSRPVGFASTQNPDADTYENKREQRADVRQIDHLIDARKHRAYAYGHPGQDGRHIGSSESRMNLCE